VRFLSPEMSRFIRNIRPFFTLDANLYSKKMFPSPGGASTSSAEAIGLNLQRALKAAGLSKGDMANCMRAQMALKAINADPQLLARTILTQRSLASSGVPAAEIARVLGNKTVKFDIFYPFRSGDGCSQGKDYFQSLAEQALAAVGDETGEFSGQDVDAAVKFYEQMVLRVNVRKEVVEFMDK